jgi:hypothetical protein
MNNLIDSNNQIRMLLVQTINGLNNSQENARRQANRRWTRAYNPSLLFEASSIIPMQRNRDARDARDARDTRDTRDNYITTLLENFLQPVDVHPTLSQIESATRRVQYSDISRPTNTACPISMEEFNDNDTVTVIRHCGHIFHTDSIMNWFRSNCRCPVCRFDIRDYISTTSREYSNRTRDPSNNNTERNFRNIISQEFGNGIVPNYLETLYNIFDLSNNNLSYNISDNNMSAYRNV